MSADKCGWPPSGLQEILCEGDDVTCGSCAGVLSGLFRWRANSIETCQVTGIDAGLDIHDVGFVSCKVVFNGGTRKVFSQNTRSCRVTINSSRQRDRLEQHSRSRHFPEFLQRDRAWASASSKDTAVNKRKRPVSGGTLQLVSHRQGVLRRHYRLVRGSPNSIPGLCPNPLTSEGNKNLMAECQGVLPLLREGFFVKVNSVVLHARGAVFLAHAPGLGAGFPGQVDAVSEGGALHPGAHCAAADVLLCILSAG